MQVIKMSLRNAIHVSKTKLEKKQFQVVLCHHKAKMIFVRQLW